MCNKTYLLLILFITIPGLVLASDNNYLPEIDGMSSYNQEILNQLMEEFNRKCIYTV